jgi:hypothetical protein
MKGRITQKAQDTDFRQGLNIKTQEGYPMIEVSLPRPLGGDSLLTIVLTINKLSSIKRHAGTARVLPNERVLCSACLSYELNWLVGWLVG